MAPADPRPGPAELAAKVLTRAKSRGWREVAGLGAHRFLEQINSADSVVFFTRSLGTTEPVLERPTGARALELTPAHGPRFAADIGTDSPRTFERRLAAGQSCFAAEYEGRLVHASWLTTAGAWVREVRRYFYPAAGQGYVYESYTRPEMRGHHLWPYAMSFLASVASNRGLTSLWVGVEGSNEAARRAVERAGFELALEVNWRRRVGFLSLGSTVSGNWGFSLSRQASRSG